MRRLALFLGFVLLGCGGGGASGGGGGHPVGNGGTTVLPGSGGMSGVAGAGGEAVIGGGGGAAPICRAATDACAVTTDCCPSLICTNNICTAPPLCRPADGACAVTTDCCDPLVCLSNKCSAVVVGTGGAGGAPATGGHGGGAAPGTGGVGTGGIASTGGSLGTGGAGTGGVIGTGGVASTGGVVGTGGLVGTGGSTPLCRAQGGACAITADCCNGLTCQGTSCLPPPICGDGTCNSGETQANCCSDCGCLAGAYCSASTKTCLAASTLMMWTFTDSCADGLAIQFRFFDKVNGVLWPGTLANTYQSSTDGQTVNQQIACIPGASICYGAEPNPTPDTIHWGVGLDGSYACTSCCATCGAINPQLTLTCN